MNKIINNELDSPYLIKDIPKELHNIKLNDEQLLRLSQGLSTGLIEGIIFENGEIQNAKISLSKNRDTGKIEINYNYQEEALKIPDNIFGVELSEEQKQSLFNGELLGGFTMNGQSLFVGVDDKLNKVVVKTQRELKIPNELLNYTLDPVDKQYLANGKMTDERMFQTSNGDFFTARVSLTKDKKGIELVNIKNISKSRAIEIKDTLNKSKVVTDEKLLLNMPGIAANMEHSKRTFKPVEAPIWQKESLHNTKIIRERETQINNSLSSDHLRSSKKTTSKSVVSKQETQIIKKNGKVFEINKKPKREFIKYNSTSGSEKGFTINPEKLFTPNSFKGVTLTPEQKKSYENFDVIKIKGANMKDGISDVNIWKTKEGYFKSEVIEKLNIVKSPTNVIERGR